MGENQSIDSSYTHRPKGLSNRLIAPLMVPEPSCIVEPMTPIGGLNQHRGSVADIQKGHLESRVARVLKKSLIGLVSFKPHEP